MYYECHITVEPVFDERLERFSKICQAYRFKVADLLLKTRSESTPLRSEYDTFCSGKGLEREELEGRMRDLLIILELEGFKIWRYKIEHVVLDKKFDRMINSSAKE